MSKAAVPPIDDFIMQVLGMSEAQYHGDWIIGWSLYNEQRPRDWPTAFVVLRFYGFAMSANGWSEFVQAHIGRPVVTTQALREMQTAQHPEQKPSTTIDARIERTTIYSEALDAVYPGGLPVCEETYRRTGRMFLR